MNHFHHLAVRTAVWALLSSICTASQRDWTIRDSIELTTFRPPMDSGLNALRAIANNPIPEPLSIKFVSWSPDGRYFLVLKNRGVLARDLNVTELAVYSFESVREALQSEKGGRVAPVGTHVRESDSSIYSSIGEAAWELNSKAVTFVGFDYSNAHGRQLFRWDFQADSLCQLSFSDSIFRVDSRDGDTWRDGGLICKKRISMPRQQLTAVYPKLFAPQYPQGALSLQVNETDVVVGEANFASFAGGQSFKLDRDLTECWIAPGGKRAIAVSLSRCNDREYVGIDLLTGQIQTIAPVQSKELPANAIWSPDGSRALLTGVIPPKAEPEIGAQVVSIGLLDVHFDGPKIATNEFFMSLDRDGPILDIEETQIGFLMVQRQEDGTSIRTAYRFTEGTWMLQPNSPFRAPKHATKADLRIFVRQDFNTPPVLVASDGKRELILDDPNPQLADVWRAPETLFKWQDPDGRVAIGALLLPRGFQPGQRIPLVLQLQGEVDPRLFLPDAAANGGGVAQQFVAQGFAVLKVPIRRDELDAALEGPGGLARLEAAVSELDRAAIIDPARVGAIGFSRTGYQVNYAISHPGKLTLACAVIVDSTTQTLIQLLAQWVPDSPKSFADSDLPFTPNRVGTFWRTKADWLKHDVVFNADRVRTPALFAFHLRHPAGFLDLREYGAHQVIAAFGANRKPVDVFYLPQAIHQPVRPVERNAEMAAIVDWMCFWLKGEVPSDPERAARWVVLRKQQDEVLKTPPPPKGKWVFVPDAEQPPWIPPTDSVRAAGTGTSSSAEAEGKEETSPAEPKLD